MGSGKRPRLEKGQGTADIFVEGMSRCASRFELWLAPSFLLPDETKGVRIVSKHDMISLTFGEEDMHIADNISSTWPPIVVC